jgi:protein SCO1/2
VKRALSLVLALVAARAFAQAQNAPAALADVSIDQRLGASLPLDAAFRDETGRTVRLGDFFHQRPVLLSFVYFECPMLCSYVESGTLKAMRALSFTPGKEFELVTVSIDPADLPKIAATKKADFLNTYGRAAAGPGVHFLTGQAESIAAITRAAGFRYERDPETKSFSHAAGIMLATSDGRLSKYFYGIEYSARDLKLAMMEASNERIGSPVDRVLLYCSHYDPTTGKYGLVVMRVVRLAGLVTVGLLGAFMLLMFRRDRKRPGEPPR